MADYMIMGALKKCAYGKLYDFNCVYVDKLKFRAKTDAEALEYAKKRQREHNEEYLKYFGVSSDIAKAPNYAENVYFVGAGGVKTWVNPRRQEDAIQHQKQAHRV